MSKRFAVLSATCATSVLALAGSAFAQYSTGFEAGDNISASTGGTILTGQDSYYIPSGTVSTDYLAFTYAGNTYGVNANPQGGDQFVAVEGPGGGTYGRAQRDMDWGTTGGATAEYDVACLYTGGPPASNNLGSFSIQPYPGSASAIHLFTYVDINNPTTWQAGYLGYDANGVAMAAPGFIPGAEWTNLELNHWYHLSSTIDFDTNQIVEATIVDLTTNQSTTAPVTGVYLEGGSNGGSPLPTGFRMFSGGGAIGNIVAFDNMEIAPTSGGGYTCEITGTCPGNIQVNWAGAQPSETQGIVFASNTGSFTINSGACAGTQLGLGTRNLQLVRTISTGSGSGSIGRAVNSGACGGFVQLVTVGSPCEASTVGQIP